MNSFEGWILLGINSHLDKTATWTKMTLGQTYHLDKSGLWQKSLWVNGTWTKIALTKIAELPNPNSIIAQSYILQNNSYLSTWINISNISQVLQQDQNSPNGPKKCHNDPKIHKNINKKTYKAKVICRNNLISKYFAGLQRPKKKPNRSPKISKWPQNTITWKVRKTNNLTKLKLLVLVYMIKAQTCLLTSEQPQRSPKKLTRSQNKSNLGERKWKLF